MFILSHRSDLLSLLYLTGTVCVCVSHTHMCVRVYVARGSRITPVLYRLCAYIHTAHISPLGSSMNACECAVMRSINPPKNVYTRMARSEQQIPRYANAHIDTNEHTHIHTDTGI